MGIRSRSILPAVLSRPEPERRGRRAAAKACAPRGCRKPISTDWCDPRGRVRLASRAAPASFSFASPNSRGNRFVLRRASWTQCLADWRRSGGGRGVLARSPAALRVAASRGGGARLLSAGIDALRRDASVPRPRQLLRRLGRERLRVPVGAREAPSRSRRLRLRLWRRGGSAAGSAPARARAAAPAACRRDFSSGARREARHPSRRTAGGAPRTKLAGRGRTRADPRGAALANAIAPDRLWCRRAGGREAWPRSGNGERPPSPFATGRGRAWRITAPSLPRRRRASLSRRPVGAAASPVSARRRPVCSRRRVVVATGRRSFSDLLALAADRHDTPSAAQLGSSGCAAPRKASCARLDRPAI